MEEISVFSSELQNSEFWRKPEKREVKNCEISHLGTLFTLDEGFEFVAKLYALVGHILLSIELNCQEKVFCLEGDLQWVQITPFEEPHGNNSLYGFTLTHGETLLDFYTSSKEDLDQWLHHLQPVAVFTDFTEDYDLLKRIGTGGQSVVYLAQEKLTGEKVAVKVYNKKALVGRRVNAKAVVSEVKILRELNHPNIEKLRGVYEDWDHVYLILEFIPGQSLHDSLLSAGPYSENDAKAFLSLLLSVLAYLSKHSIIHRDIKPENIILASEGRIQFKLVDFGFAMTYEGVEILNNSGSPGYCAPEILMGRKHGPMVDVYAAGIVMYTILSGSNPFASATHQETLRKNRLNDITFGTEWRQISPTLVSLIKVMTNLNPADRMSVSELQAWLRRDLQPALLTSAFRRGSLQLYQLDADIASVQTAALTVLEAAAAYHRKRNSH